MVEIGGSSGRTKLNCPKKYEFKGCKMWLVELHGPANVDEPMVVVAQFTEQSLQPPEVCGSYPVELKFEKNIFDKLSQNSLTSNFQRLKFLEIELLLDIIDHYLSSTKSVFFSPVTLK